ncbi:MAG: hypothetical protein WBL06_07220 [Pseudolysinimonas sp.]|uniref:hypothetical protein n=1 Tax=Pseudolysinimonas sp. TaxID=2680009 RepID=UPI003C76B187
MEQKDRRRAQKVLRVLTTQLAARRPRLENFDSQEYPDFAVVIDSVPHNGRVMPGSRLLASPEGSGWGFWRVGLDGESGEPAKIERQNAPAYPDRAVAQYLLRLCLEDLADEMNMIKSFMEAKGIGFESLPPLTSQAYNDAFTVSLLVASTIDRHYG